jgi:hypothetical protein
VAFSEYMNFKKKKEKILAENSTSKYTTLTSPRTHHLEVKQKAIQNPIGFAFLLVA